MRRSCFGCAPRAAFCARLRRIIDWLEGPAAGKIVERIINSSEGFPVDGENASGDTAVGLYGEITAEQSCNRAAERVDVPGRCGVLTAFLYSLRCV